MDETLTAARGAGDLQVVVPALAVAAMVASSTGIIATLLFSPARSRRSRGWEQRPIAPATYPARIDRTLCEREGCRRGSPGDRVPRHRTRRTRGGGDTSGERRGERKAGASAGAVRGCRRGLGRSRLCVRSSRVDSSRWALPAIARTRERSLGAVYTRHARFLRTRRCAGRRAGRQRARARDERQRLAEFRRGNLGCRHRAGPQAEDRLVERGDELRAVAVAERLDERARRMPSWLGLSPVSRACRARRGPAASRRAGPPRAPPPPTARRSRRAARRATRAAAPSGTARPGRATAPSGRAPRPSSGSSSASAIRARRSAASGPRNWSSRVGSPGGCVAAIGSTGRMPNGRQSRRSKRTGPAAIAPAVARRSALTASASSPGASGGSRRPPGSVRSSSRTQSRSGSRPKPVGSRPFASGQWRASSPAAAARRRMPPPSSTGAPPEIPIERRDGGVARAPRRRASARARRRRGRTPRRSSRSRRTPRPCDVTSGSRTRPEERLVLVARRSRVGAGEDLGGGLARRSSSASARVPDARDPVGARLDERLDERPVLVERGPAGERAPRRRTAARRRAPALAEATNEPRQKPAGTRRGAGRARSELAYAAAGSSPLWHSGHQ